MIPVPDVMIVGDPRDFENTVMVETQGLIDILDRRSLQGILGMILLSSALAAIQ